SEGDLFMAFAFEEGCPGEAVEEEYSSVQRGPIEVV
ncbi:hypothetical protein A2U01_0112244, partial [Trifolium medium]|nr:hypothetical protein [Trifolium medium]